MRESSVEMLQGYLANIVESIVSSVAQCPPVMRVAFKQLHKRVEEQFPEPQNEVSLPTVRGQRSRARRLNQRRALMSTGGTVS